MEGRLVAGTKGFRPQGLGVQAGVRTFGAGLTSMCKKWFGVQAGRKARSGIP